MSARFDWGPVMAAAKRGEMPLVQFGCDPAAVARHGVQPVYLATPYSRQVVDQHGRWSRLLSVEAMLSAAGEVRRLKSVGVSAFSPIITSAAVVQECEHDPKEFEAHHPLDADAWLRWCQPFLNVCGAVVVPDLQGWDRSEGIKAEVSFAITRGVPLFVYAAGDDHEG